MGEIRKGIEKVSSAAKKASLEAFVARMHLRFDQRILPIDAAVIDRWGKLCGASEAKGIKLPAIDSLIAATAIEHNLTLVTRNVSDFKLMGCAPVNPWK